MASSSQEYKDIESEDGRDQDDIPFTSSEDLKQIIDGDTTVEIIGYVDNIESTRIVGMQNHKIFKFFVNNGEGERIQVIAWGDDIMQIEPRIKPNCILHIDGARCKFCHNPNFNKGTVGFELVFQSITILNVLGKYDVESEIDDYVPDLVQIYEVGDITKFIRLQGYIKSNLYIMKQQISIGPEFCYGSITDGIYKLEVKVPQSETLLDYEKGDHIEVTGYVQTNANPIHIYVKSSNDIKKIDDKKMPLRELLKGIQPAPRNNEWTAAKEVNNKKRKFEK